MHYRMYIIYLRIVYCIFIQYKYTIQYTLYVVYKVCARHITILYFSNYAVYNGSTFIVQCTTAKI